MRLLITFAALIALSSTCYAFDNPIDVRLAHGSEQEKRTDAQLKRLLQQFDLSTDTYTRTIVIDERQIPHSHPVLTLHTRHLNDDDLLLSTYLHEQLHWLLRERKSETDAAKAKLESMFPKLPVGFPEGSDTEEGNYVHLVLITLEWRALERLRGELQARQVMQFWAADHYTTIFSTVLLHRDEIESVIKDAGLTSARH